MSRWSTGWIVGAIVAGAAGYLIAIGRADPLFAAIAAAFAVIAVAETLSAANHRTWEAQRRARLAEAEVERLRRELSSALSRVDAVDGDGANRQS